MARKKLSPRLIDGRGGVWYIAYNDGQRSRSVSTGTEDRGQAELALAGFLSGAPVVLRGDAPATFADVWQRYVDQHKVRDEARRDYAGRWLCEHFGHMAVADIVRADVRAYADKRRAGLIGRPAQDATIRKELGAMAAALNFNVSRVEPKAVRLDPRALPHIDLPPKGAPKDRVLTDDEISRLYEAADESEWFGRLVLLLLETGSRSDAILDLTWEQVDLARGIVHLNAAGREQTAKRRAVVPIRPDFRVRLATWRGDARKVVGAPATVKKTIRRRLDGLGLRDVTPHTFRHTFITRGIERGVSFEAMAKIVGDSITTLEKNYLHLRPDYLQDELGKIWN